MFLITTADQRFWKTEEKILFLGEWCKLFSQKSVWEKLSYKVQPYHWDNRQKLYHDYLYLDKLYEQTLFRMKDILNKIHGVDHSLRYWRIIIGPWLFYFIQILYDRYLSIMTAVASRKVTNTLIGRYERRKWLPLDFPCYLNWFVNDDYNHYIYDRIIEFTDKLPFETIDVKDENNIEEQVGRIKSPYSPKNVFKKIIGLYEKLIPDRLNQILLITSYLSTLDTIKLQLSLKQLPYLSPPDVTSPRADIDLGVRDELLSELFNRECKEFEQLLGVMIAEQIPLIYLEGYAQMAERSLRAYPHKPRVIFTANAHSSNEAFKFWAAYCVDRGAKLLGTQHGGHYGTGLWLSTEEHEIKIDDFYYTWGWESDVYKNTRHLAAAKLNKVKSVGPKKDGRILLVLSTMPRYSYHLYSVPIAATGTMAYFDEQYKFVGALLKDNQKRLLVRLYQQDLGWSQKERWGGKFPEVECYMGNKSMLDQLRESRLFIGTYNATTYLETFAANFPTIIFWNPSQWELRAAAQPYFDELRNAGIFHDTPESAAAKVNEVARDPVSWWQQPEIQRAKDQFCSKFARTSDNWLTEWKEMFLNITSSL